MARRLADFLMVASAAWFRGVAAHFRRAQAKVGPVASAAFSGSLTRSVLVIDKDAGP
ncbi:MAG: hypothetical protein AAGH57_00310 [Pseudomonadota bacterium]